MAERIKWSSNQMIAGGASLLVLALVLVASFLVFNRTEHRVSTQSDGTLINILHCKSKNPADAFFSSAGASDYSHELKVTFSYDVADKISYNYYGAYESEAAAKTAVARLHADYNIFLGNYNIDPETLYPTFANVGSEMRINLYGDEKSLNSTVAGFFFLNRDESLKFYEYTSDDFMKIYTDKGFTCVYDE